MAIRKTTHVLKHSTIPNRALPSSLLTGEPIVNTAEGIVYFSGVSSSTNEWVPSGVNPNFFEVGSNLYDLSLRNRIIKYEGQSGSALVDKILVGTSSGFTLVDKSTLVSSLDTYVTGATYDQATDTLTLSFNQGKPDINVTGITDYYVTGATLIGSTVYFNRNDTLSAFTLDLSSLDVNDTYVSGMTYSPSQLTLSRTEGEPDLTVIIDTFTGATVQDLTQGRVVFVGTNGKLIDQAGFTYDSTTKTLSTPTDGAMNVGTGGLIVGSGGDPDTPGVGDVVIHGNLTVFGDSVKSFTNELYAEDPRITLNYNPTGDTSNSSVNSGIVIQDGSGVAGSDVVFAIVRGANLTGTTTSTIPDISEYTGTTGYGNRVFITELNDIVIRSTDSFDDGTAGSVNGVRVLAEFDILDGGTY
jgi:hypothetical protein